MIALALMLAAAQPQVDLRAQAFPGIGEDGHEVGCMRMDRGYMLTSSEELGGYSGASFDPETAVLTLLSDRAHLLEVPLSFGEKGEVTGVGPALRLPLEVPDEFPSSPDTEALVAYGGGYLAARERTDDVLFIRRDGDAYRAEEILVSLGSIVNQPRNSGFEGAALAGDRLLLLSEDVRDGSGAIYEVTGGSAREIARFPVGKRFAVTEAAVGGEHLFVLERAFDRKRGPRARVSAVPLAQLEEGGMLSPTLLGRMNFLDGADNMEAMAFRRGPSGEPRLLLVSDDNFNPVQRTVLMDLDLSACALPAPTETGTRGDEEAED